MFKRGLSYKKVVLLLLASLFLSLSTYVLLIYTKQLGSLEGPGEITGEAVPQLVIKDRVQEVDKVKTKLTVETDKQILFGDLHVHTTYSTDAFLFSLPYLNGTGASPIGDACDYARYCSALDFWSINDHAEALTPRKWRETIDSINQCNDLSNGSNDLISFLGYEWTQVNQDYQKHFGHKNIIFRERNVDKVPPRPIAAGGIASEFMQIGLPMRTTIFPAIVDFKNRERIINFQKFIEEVGLVPQCPEAESSRDLDVNCIEIANDPKELTDKLDDWETPYMVIPHGTTWGFYTPPNADWRKQLKDFYNPQTQNLFEIFSGHGNNEEYRTWNDTLLDADGIPYCPEPSGNFIPTCYQAGKIMESRCKDSGMRASECDELVRITKKNAALMGAGGFMAVRETEPDDFLNAGQCNDCYLPAFNYRPLGSAQYILAMTDFSKPGIKNRIKAGFIGSSDNHGARPGTGYKQIDRNQNTEAYGFSNATVEWLNNLDLPRGKLKPYMRPRDQVLDSSSFTGLTDLERQSAYFMTGGLVATHSESKSREDIWDSLDRREVYATTGTRILLWFNANHDEDIYPMGSEFNTDKSPVFTVKTAGSFKQKPGCPDYSDNMLGKERLEEICNNECYNPSSERKIIERIEVVKILPQSYENESINELIFDKWKSFDCNKSICEFRFIDEDFENQKRDAVYYVRVIEEASNIIGADPLGCEFNEKGECIKTTICRAGHEQNRGDCLAKSNAQAWSSPIFVNSI